MRTCHKPWIFCYLRSLSVLFSPAGAGRKAPKAMNLSKCPKVLGQVGVWQSAANFLCYTVTDELELVIIQGHPSSTSAPFPRCPAPESGAANKTDMTFFRHRRRSRTLQNCNVQCEHDFKKFTTTDAKMAMAHFFHLHDFDTKHEREKRWIRSFYELLSSVTYSTKKCVF